MPRLCSKLACNGEIRRGVIGQVFGVRSTAYFNTDFNTDTAQLLRITQLCGVPQEERFGVNLWRVRQLVTLGGARYP